jgi:hypothetical protein
MECALEYEEKQTRLNFANPSVNFVLRLLGCHKGDALHLEYEFAMRQVHYRYYISDLNRLASYTRRQVRKEFL